jgi:capsular polysaccharide biosynthesis protein
MVKMFRFFKSSLKVLIKPVHKFTINILRRLPISSELIGPPKGFYPSTLDWVTASDIGQDTTKGIYIEVHSGYKLTRLNPKTLDNTIHWQYRLQSTYEFPKTFVVVVPYGRVWREKGVVISPDDKILADVSIELETFNVKNTKNHSVFSQIKLPSLTKLNKTVALLSSGGGNIYFHWMFDILPRFHLLQCGGVSINSIDYFLVNSIHQNFQVETLSILGIPKTKIIESHDFPHIKAERLIVPSLPSIPAQVPKWVCDFLREKFLSRENERNKNYPERIYISRSKASHRRVLNESDVVNVAKEYGFEVFQLESMTVAEQAILFSSAKVVIAPHGGGLSNIIFCEPGTKIIEFFSPNYIIPCFWGISNQLDLEYYYLLGEGLSPSLPEDFDDYLLRKDFIPDLRKDIVLNLNSLSKIMKLAGVE